MHHLFIASMMAPVIVLWVFLMTQGLVEKNAPLYIMSILMTIVISFLFLIHLYEAFSKLLWNTMLTFSM